MHVVLTLVWTEALRLCYTGYVAFSPCNMPITVLFYSISNSKCIKSPCFGEQRPRGVYLVMDLYGMIILVRCWPAWAVSDSCHIFRLAFSSRRKHQGNCKLWLWSISNGSSCSQIDTMSKKNLSGYQRIIDD